MKTPKNPFNPTLLLWWVAIISLVITGTIYYLLGEQAQYDVDLNQRRIFIPVIGVIIAGICIIAGTSGRWFYPK